MNEDQQNLVSINQFLTYAIEQKQTVNRWVLPLLMSCVCLKDTAACVICSGQLTILRPQAPNDGDAHPSSGN
uniref:Transposase n=1 Tax=Globodera rostochiensis TaxID=31243 RepID=A0A914GVN9_GLORO